VADDYFVLT